MQPNCYATSKKTSVADTSISVLCIQQSSTTKNIQLVTLPKYSIPKGMTNLGTDLSNVKSYLQESYAIPSYHKESK